MLRHWLVGGLASTALPSATDVASLVAVVRDPGGRPEILSAACQVITATCIRGDLGTDAAARGMFASLGCVGAIMEDTARWTGTPFVTSSCLFALAALCGDTSEAACCAANVRQVMALGGVRLLTPLLIDARTNAALAAPTLLLCWHLVLLPTTHGAMLALAPPVLRVLVRHEALERVAVAGLGFFWSLSNAHGHVRQLAPHAGVFARAMTQHMASEAAVLAGMAILTNLAVLPEHGAGLMQHVEAVVAGMRRHIAHTRLAECALTFLLRQAVCEEPDLWEAVLAHLPDVVTVMTRHADVETVVLAGVRVLRNLSSINDHLHALAPHTAAVVTVARRFPGSRAVAEAAMAFLLNLSWLPELCPPLLAHAPLVVEVLTRHGDVLDTVEECLGILGNLTYGDDDGPAVVRSLMVHADSVARAMARHVASEEAAARGMGFLALLARRTGQDHQLLPYLDVVLMALATHDSAVPVVSQVMLFLYGVAHLSTGPDVGVMRHVDVIVATLTRHAAEELVVDPGLGCLWVLSAGTYNKAAIQAHVTTVMRVAARYEGNQDIVLPALALLAQLAMVASYTPALMPYVKTAVAALTRFRGDDRVVDGALEFLHHLSVVAAHRPALRSHVPLVTAAVRAHPGVRSLALTGAAFLANVACGHGADSCRGGVRACQ